MLPLLILVWSSLLPYYRPPSWKALSAVTLENYWELFASPALLNVAGNTLLLGGISSIAIMFLAILCSWFVYRTNITGRKVLDVVVFLPYAVSGMGHRRGVPGGVSVVPEPAVQHHLDHRAGVRRQLPSHRHPLHQRRGGAGTQGAGGGRLVGSGAGFWTTLRFVWFPLLLPALVNGFLFVLILSFKVMSIAMLLRGPDSMVLSVYLWHLWDTGNPGHVVCPFRAAGRGGDGTERPGTAAGRKRRGRARAVAAFVLT